MNTPTYGYRTHARETVATPPQPDAPDIACRFHRALGGVGSAESSIHSHSTSALRD